MPARWGGCWAWALGALAVGADGPAKRPSFEVELDLRTHRPERRRLDRPRGVPPVLRLCAPAKRQARGSEPGVRSARRRTRMAWCRRRNTCRRPRLRSRPRRKPPSPQAAPMPAPAPMPAGERPVVDGPITPEQLSFFEAKIRPVLIENCYKCHCRDVGQDQGELRARHAGGDPQGGRPGRRRGAGQPRGKPADPGGPLQGRRPQDAAQDQAAGRGDRRPRALGGDGAPRPARRQGAGRREGDRHRGGTQVLGVPAAPEVGPARGEG